MVHSDLNGRYAVITGGTQGLGEAVARLFSERGAAGIVICGRNEVRGNKVASELTAGGCPTYFVQADLASVEDCRRVADRADSSFGKVHALVNCAAMTDRGTILDTSQELFDRIFAVNVRAPFFLMQESAKVMRREGIAGTMVNILSVTSHGGSSFLCPYSSSKGALSTLTKNVAFSLLRDRIRVNGLNLGWMDTPGEHAIRTKYHDAPPDWLEVAESKLPFGRLIKADEVARVVAFLSSEESGMMTGSIIDFDQSVTGSYDAAPYPAATLP